MKTLTILLLMISVLTSNSFSQDIDVNGLLDKPGTRNEIFNTIIKDHALFNEFMKVIKDNEHANVMMKNEYHQTGEMKANKEKMEICEKDSTICCPMADLGEQHQETKKAMIQKRNETGMVKMDNIPMMEIRVDEKELLHKR